MRGASGQEFGGLLRAHRRRAGFTQQELANLATLSVRTVRDLEAGHVARPHRRTVQLLIDALGLDSGRAPFTARRPQLELVAVEADPVRSPRPDGETQVVHTTLTVTSVQWQRLLAVLDADGVATVTIAIAGGREKTSGGSVGV